MAMATTFSEDQTTEKHVDHLPQLPRPSPQTVTSNTLPHYGHPQPTLLQPGPAQYAPSPYPQYGYRTGLPTPESAPLVSGSMSSSAFLPPGMHRPNVAEGFPAGMDTTGQIAPPGMKPRVTATLWEDEGSLCFQIEARGICVARREDNHMINGTRLLNVAGMTRGRRDRILKSEKVRNVVKIGPMHLKGVWIPFERALDFANKEKITEMVYPLFVHNIGALLYHPTNQTRTNQVMAAAERRKAEAGGQMRHSGPATTASVQEPMLEHGHHKVGTMPATPEVSDDDESNPPKQSSSNDLVWKSTIMEEAETIVSGREGSMKPKFSSVIEKPKNDDYYSSFDEKKYVSHQFTSTSQSGTTARRPQPAVKRQFLGNINSYDDLTNDYKRSDSSDDDQRSMRGEIRSSSFVKTSDNKDIHLNSIHDLRLRYLTRQVHKGVVKSKPNITYRQCRDALQDNGLQMNPAVESLLDETSTGISDNDDVHKALPQIIIGGDQSSGKSSLLESLSKVLAPKDQQLCIGHTAQIISQRTTDAEYVDVGEYKDAHTQIGNLSPSQNSPQSDTEHSSDSEAGLLTRNERRSVLIERLMAYFFELMSSCPSPVPSTTAESPLMPNAKNRRSAEEDDTTPPPLPLAKLLNQSMDRQSPLYSPRPQIVLQTYQSGASLIYDSYHQHNDEDNSPIQDGLDSGAGQSHVSANTTASENTQSYASNQSTGPNQKRDREKEDDDKDERQSYKRTRLNDGRNTAPKRLACPYFKNDPEHPRLGRSCSGPGWGTVHRIKEHLDRNHALPPSCVRCYTAFDTEADRDTHMRLQDQCQVRERPGRMHGFDAAQKEQLRSRPKGYKHMSETQKWCHIYMILFPETASTEVPSPYYEFVSFRDSGHPVDPMTEYENFLRHEMPDRVRHQLELRIEEALNPVEETLRGQIVDIVRDVQLELFQSFRASTGPTRPNGDCVQESASIEIDDYPDKSQDEEREDTDAQDSTLVARNTEPPGQFDSGQCSWKEQLEAYRQVPPLDFSFTDFDDFDGALFDFSSVIPAAQDSAYGTLSISQEETDKDEFIGNGTGT